MNAIPTTHAIMQLREGWLEAAAEFLKAHMHERGISCPDVRVSCGWPSRGGTRQRSRVIGQCFDGTTCKDGKPQLFVSPVIDDSIVVLGTELHEMIHAAVGCEHGHKKPFSQAARRVGLAGRPTATVVGDALRPILEAFVTSVGPYPHTAIDLGCAVASPSPEADEEGKGASRSRLRLFECECDPPIKVRVAHDTFEARCTLCDALFHRVSHSHGGGLIQRDTSPEGKATVPAMIFQVRKERISC